MRRSCDEAAGSQGSNVDRTRRATEGGSTSCGESRPSNSTPGIRSNPSFRTPLSGNLLTANRSPRPSSTSPFSTRESSTRGRPWPVTSAPAGRTSPRCFGGCSHFRSRRRNPLQSGSQSLLPAQRRDGFRGGPRLPPRLSFRPQPCAHATGRTVAEEPPSSRNPTPFAMSSMRSSTPATPLDSTMPVATTQSTRTTLSRQPCAGSSAATPRAPFPHAGVDGGSAFAAGHAATTQNSSGPSTPFWSGLMSNSSVRRL